MADTLKPAHRMFVRTYLANGNNGTQAYLAAYPRSSASNARTCASDLLARPYIQAEIARVEGKREAKFFASRENLLAETESLYRECRDNRIYATALNSIDQAARLSRLYDRDNVDTEGYTQLIQTLIINTQVVDPVTEGRTVDTTTCSATDDNPQDVTHVTEDNHNDIEGL